MESLRLKFLSVVLIGYLVPLIVISICLYRGVFATYLYPF